MVTEQETLIYIEDQDKKDASVAANAFAHKDTKNRAYINTLGADLALKYLASENIDVSNVYNIHSIKKILEEMDISDIMLPNIHIDVRVVFDDNVIFIPKSHFEYNIEPDIYLVFSLAKDFSHVKFLGFFEPRLINKNNSNDKYYFIEKEKLNSAIDLKKYIESHKGNTTEALSQEDIENSERIIISMADNDISENDKKYLIKQLTKSAELRDKFIEYENFETLSYKAMTDPQIQRKEISENTSAEITDLSILDELDNMTDIPAEEIQNENLSEEVTENSDNTNNEESNSTNDFSELNLEPIEDIQDLTLENNTNTETDSSNNTDNNQTSTLADLTDIGGAIAGGIAAGATAAAAGEILNTAGAAETALNAADTALNIVDSGIEIAKDLLTDKTENIEPISFENIDTSSIDNITAPEENIEEETISLGDVKLPEETENTDFIDQIDNKISFDDINTDNTLEEPAPFNMDDEPISLNNIDTSNLIETEESEKIEENTISFDNIDTSNIQNSIDIDNETIDNTISFDDINLEENTDNLPQTDINLEDNKLSFENIDNENIKTDIDSNNFTDNDKISLDNIDIEPMNTDLNITGNNENETNISFDDLQINDISEETNTSEQNQNDNNIDISDFMDDSISLDDNVLNEPELSASNENTETENNIVENLNEENNNNENISFDNFDDIVTEPLEQTIEPEIVEDTQENNEDQHINEGFGKNLMENLSADNLDDISIEDLGIDENIPHNNEDISSNDLLSQIDDILNSTSTEENTNIETEPQNEIENITTPQENATSFEDIPEISDIADISDFSTSSDSTNGNNENPSALDELNPIEEDSTTGLLSEDEIHNDDNSFFNNNTTEDTSIDDLLNFDDNTNPHAIEEEVTTETNSSENDEDNIGVLFNDTDPTSDTELDEISENNQEIPQNQIPGGALLNNKNKTPNKKLILVAAALVTVLAAASAVMFLKPKNDAGTDVDPIKTESTENNIASDNTNTPATDDSTENILATNAPEINKNQSKNIQKSQTVKELKSTPQKAKQSAESYMSVNKLVWDVPSNLSYSTKFQNYLRTAGKSIKLSLSADLLLATEYAYTNQVKVNLKLNKDGNVQDAKIASSSGSTEIDNIVLQSVKDTLNVVKPPIDEIKTPDYNLSLIIYF